ncbi:MAG TPA: glycogen debranching N-terminal domain-containing protein [Terrimesophilobacter sp.]|nr:glycogen debranching N-terminal domain-containing protein [Terrimesophilobacter sp.]
MSAPLQPLLHNEFVVLRAPTQAWSARDGSIGTAPIHGLYFSDVRVVSQLSATVGGEAGEHIATEPLGADSMSFVTLLRHLDDRAADPKVRSSHTRTATATTIRETLTVSSHLDTGITTEAVVALTADLCDMDRVKAGAGTPAEPEVTVQGEQASWSNDSVRVRLEAPGATVEASDSRIELRWPVIVPPHGETTISWTIAARDEQAVVTGVDFPPRWSTPEVTADDERLPRWLDTALGDLDALRMATVDQPGLVFLAAGAPWFFTLFGRDSIWAARFMLPLGTELAHDTLRVLAGLQGTKDVAASAEQPGKIMHELRRGTLRIPDEAIALPPLYYGTVDATALWICLLHDAWRWGLADDAVRELLPHLVAALGWMRDYGDADGDGLLEYIDRTGHGLANQGWKDSGDSVQWRDGTLAEGPIALCEVQAYAYEAATHGADLLEHFGVGGAEEWRAWAAALKTRFHESFWIDAPDGAYPAIALDAAKRPVDTVTSNLGHLLGTGLLDEHQAALVARRLVSPELDSGFGLRTMSTDSGGYWALSYHGGSVWTHDTAIAIAGLAREGFSEEAGRLVSGLLAAASGFDYRMPELHSGDPASRLAVPVPYPAACRPQAWSAAAAVSVLGSVLGLDPDAQAGVLRMSPSGAVGLLTVSGIRFGGAEVSVRVTAEGEVAYSSGATIDAR